MFNMIKYNIELLFMLQNLESIKETKTSEENGKYRAVIKFLKLTYLDTGFYSCLTKDANVDEPPSIYLFVAGNMRFLLLSNNKKNKYSK